eukprot:6212398-Pleurochrysis_carterae.AAC.5
MGLGGDALFSRWAASATLWPALVGPALHCTCNASAAARTAGSTDATKSTKRNTRQASRRRSSTALVHGPPSHIWAARASVRLAPQPCALQPSLVYSQLRRKANQWRLLSCPRTLIQSS